MGGGALAAHLLRTDTNERSEVLELKGVAARSLPVALAEMEAVALGTRCRKSLYHASINTGPGEELTLEQKAAAVARLELALGLEGHARAVIEHRKEGRDHLHVVWSRIDGDTMRATHDGHNYCKHEVVARELEREFGHNRVQGAHIERDGPAGDRTPRPPRTPSPGEVQQATRTKRGLGDVGADLTRLWRAADTGPAFAAALDGAGYVRAQGDRCGFVVIDQAGGVHSLARRIEGANTKDVNARLAGVELASLPTADQARAMQRDRQAERDQARDPERDHRADPASMPGQNQARDLQADFCASETAPRAAERAPAPEVAPRAPERAQPPPERRDGPDFQQQLADSAEYRRERAETTRANDNRPAPSKSTAPAPAKEAGRAIGRAGGLLGTGIGKAAGGLLGLLGGLLGSAGAVTETATKSPPARRPEQERAAQAEPPRQPAPAPRPPSILDEIERERGQNAAGGRSAPKPERDRDDGRSRFEGRPAIRLAAVVSGGDIGWVLTAKRRLIAYSERTGDYIAEQLRELDAIMFRALHGPA